MSFHNKQALQRTYEDSPTLGQQISPAMNLTTQSRPLLSRSSTFASQSSFQQPAATQGQEESWGTGSTPTNVPTYYYGSNPGTPPLHHPQPQPYAASPAATNMQNNLETISARASPAMMHSQPASMGMGMGMGAGAMGQRAPPPIRGLQQTAQAFGQTYRNSPASNRNPQARDLIELFKEKLNQDVFQSGLGQRMMGVDGRYNGHEVSDFDYGLNGAKSYKWCNPPGITVYTLHYNEQLYAVISGVLEAFKWQKEDASDQHTYRSEDGNQALVLHCSDLRMAPAPATYGPVYNSRRYLNQQMAPFQEFLSRLDPLLYRKGKTEPTVVTLNIETQYDSPAGPPRPVRGRNGQNIPENLNRFVWVGYATYWKNAQRRTRILGELNRAAWISRDWDGNSKMTVCYVKGNCQLLLFEVDPAAADRGAAFRPKDPMGRTPEQEKSTAPATKNVINEAFGIAGAFQEISAQRYPKKERYITGVKNPDATAQNLLAIGWCTPKTRETRRLFKGNVEIELQSFETSAPSQQMASQPQSQMSMGGPQYQSHEMAPQMGHQTMANPQGNRPNSIEMGQGAGGYQHNGRLPLLATSQTPIYELQNATPSVANPPNGGGFQANFNAATSRNYGPGVYGSGAANGQRMEIG